MVAGIRTPLPLEQMAQLMPHVYEELQDVTSRLELHMKDMQVWG